MKAALFIAIVVVLAGCSTSKKEKQTMQEMKQPVHCATAKGDLRALESEKAHVGSEIGAGVGAIVPISLVVNVASGTEGTEFKVASGDYNKMIDERIADIKKTCSL